jgi:hypothetical protein
VQGTRRHLMPGGGKQSSRLKREQLETTKAVTGHGPRANVPRSSWAAKGRPGHYLHCVLCSPITPHFLSASFSQAHTETSRWVCQTCIRGLAMAAVKSVHRGRRWFEALLCVRLACTQAPQWIMAAHLVVAAPALVAIAIGC